MPIKMGGKSFAKFDDAVREVESRRGKRVENPRAYVGAIEAAQHVNRRRKKKKGKR